MKKIKKSDDNELLVPTLPLQKKDSISNDPILQAY
jgi:hypothetical protein